MNKLNTINWYLKYISKTARNKESEYSWIRCDIQKSSEIGIFHKSIQDKIEKDDLYTTEPDEFGWTYGLEIDPHVTVLYGIHDDSPEIFKECASKIKKFDIKTGKVSIFENEKYDVLKIEVESNDLHKVHETFKEKTDNTQTFPTYKPHITVAYIKKGEAKKYTKDAENKTEKISELIFQDTKNKNTKCTLL